MDRLNVIMDDSWKAAAHMEETEDEREARTLAKFPDFEAAMPRLPSRLQDISLIDNLTSYLGARNPFAHAADPETTNLWLQDNTAHRPPGATGNNVWQAKFVAAYFIKNSGRDYSKLVADVAEKVGVGKGDEAETTIAKRLEPWIDAILPAHTVDISIDGTQTEKLGPSGRSGVSTNDITLKGNHVDGDTITSTAVNLHTHPMTTTFAEPTGWAVLSDIDDTIKITQTPSPLGILRSTFVDAPTAVAGMPQLYAHINKMLGKPPFWYLSASPYNLYPFLRDFRDAHFPSGELLLREASWMDLAGFLTSLTAGTRKYKTTRMRTIQAHFPKRRFLCIGDSTQSDPEAYGDMYRAFPGWIGVIFIRRVTGVAEMNEATKNAPERFERAFEGVPREAWVVFDDPAELYERVEELVKVAA
ncbi:uncharacterized protein K452DRAFT_286331 [Aplosporella prunicola CBS 121167]|uniref:Phosphatidate phosphatase APP1 catalytic domain-containing protein n=1 Tax=Aplosporella prunicola CBS 121167 TaxID=1176127 RepID=A0A6A6BJF0_9PEZI|nr:uncharacterized protein K452DRAFT_286331 [Aplosporella prunicola CBS 121167]KAF2143503.1 hypothetical protein K452DRAFT_286331 [Aplosporella prunicola CBS 121167]